MDWLVVSLLYSSMVSMLLYYYFCRLCNVAFPWYGGLTYIVLSCGLAICRYLEWIGEFPYVLLGIFILTACGMLFQKCRLIESFVLSSLTISIYSIMAGIMQSLTFWIVSIINSEAILKCADFFQNTVVIALVILTFRIVMKSFSGSIKNIQLSALPILIITILFITLVEALVSDSIYGNSVIWDTEEGLIFPVVNNIQLLIVRLFACGGLFSALVTYQKLVTSIEHEQTIRILEQQTQTQEVYVKEARLRYEQTRSFRHDIKNHLLVLHRLLKEGKPNEANEYLEKLEEVSDTLSFHVQTGNVTVDALLSSKLAIAVQKGINIDCSVCIPKQSCVSDTDWCIVLSNALDNAISASENIPDQYRIIHLSGRLKGNIYFLNIENRCNEYTKLPLTGIGLSNIKAVFQKYNGKVEIEIVDGVFKLNALFIIPQHAEDI